MNFQFSLEMARGTRGQRRLASHQCRSTPYPLPSFRREVVLDKEIHQKKYSNALDKKEWEDATCSVCMEYPHNAVLLLCSSHDKGCRPYMCGTSYRYSNCLDQFKKAYTKVMSPRPGGQSRHGLADNSSVGSGSDWPSENCEVMELACPLCRGQVKGWTVVEPARDYLNTKKRNCMQDDCSFIGTYKELRKHVRAVHPSARSREVDPVLEQKWVSLEREREREDVISTIRSSMPGAMVLGDYVIERNHHSFGTDDEGDADDDDEGYDVEFGENFLNLFFLLHHHHHHMGNASLTTRLRRLERGYHHTSDVDNRGAAAGAGDDDNNNESPAGRHWGRVVELGRSRRRLNRRNRRRSMTDVT